MRTGFGYGVVFVIGRVDWYPCCEGDSFTRAEAAKECLQELGYLNLPLFTQRWIIMFGRPFRIPFTQRFLKR